MKTIALIFFLAGSVTLSAYAQETPQNKQVRKDNFPYWAVSKGVQRVAYKDVAVVPAKIGVTEVTTTSSKGVQRVQDRKVKRSSLVATKGYPTWTISKGVARQQAENVQK